MRGALQFGLLLPFGLLQLQKLWPLLVILLPPFMLRLGLRLEWLMP